MDYVTELYNATDLGTQSWMYNTLISVAEPWDNDIFTIAIRGVVLYCVQLIATFLNITTMVATFKYKNLQITSNALIVCFSLGNSVAGIIGTMTILTALCWTMQEILGKLHV